MTAPEDAQLPSSVNEAGDARNPGEGNVFDRVRFEQSPPPKEGAPPPDAEERLSVGSTPALVRGAKATVRSLFVSGALDTAVGANVDDEHRTRGAVAGAVSISTRVGVNLRRVATRAATGATENVATSGAGIAAFGTEEDGRRDTGAVARQLANAAVTGAAFGGALVSGVREATSRAG